MEYDWFLIILTFVITLGAQSYINHQYKRCEKIKSRKGLRGYEVARMILDANGLSSVEVVETSGFLSDHYDPRRKVVRLSSSIYHDSSIASISVASHECGHAIQDKDGYLFLKIRSSIIPFVNFSSTLGYFAILIGLFTGALGFIWIGIFFELVILLFQLVTLPVEFDASSRGLYQLEKLEITRDSEKKDCARMLRAAALTYVASVATSCLEILRLILIARRDDR